MNRRGEIYKNWTSPRCGAYLWPVPAGTGYSALGAAAGRKGRAGKLEENEFCAYFYSKITQCVKLKCFSFHGD